LHYCNVVPLLYLRLAKVVFLKFTFLPDGQPLLASGGSSGVISIWNLEKRRLHSVIREAHDGSIVSLHFFANEPILMSSAADNSVKVSACFWFHFSIAVW
jgi:WD40 repeat protein